MSSEQQDKEPGMTKVTLNKNPAAQTRPIGQDQQGQQKRGAAQQQAGRGTTGTGDDYKETESREGQTRREQMSHLEGQQGLDI